MGIQNFLCDIDLCRRFGLDLFAGQATSNRAFGTVAPKDDDKSSEPGGHFWHLVVGWLAFLRSALSKLI